MALPDIGNLHFCDIADTLAGKSFQQHGALQIISIGRAVIYFSHYFSIQSAATDSDVKRAAWKCRLKAGTGFPGARRFSDQSHSNIAEAIFRAGYAMINLFCSIKCENITVRCLLSCAHFSTRFINCNIIKILFNISFIFHCYIATNQGLYCNRGFHSRQYPPFLAKS